MLQSGLAMMKREASWKRRVTKIQQQQQELEHRQDRSAREDRNEPLAQLMNVWWKKLMNLQRAEGHGRRTTSAPRMLTSRGRMPRPKGKICLEIITIQALLNKLLNTSDAKQTLFTI